MKLTQLIIHIFALLSLLCSTAVNLEAAELLKLSRANSKDIVQLYFSFDTAPKASVGTDNKRIDLIFKGTEIQPNFIFFNADENIVKILPHKENGDLIITLYFRYKPQDYKITPVDDKTVVFEVLLGNEYSSSYDKLAERLKGLTVLDRSLQDLSNPYIASPYTGDWISFFAHYESPVTIDIPVHFTLPPFPIIALLPPNSEKNRALLGDTILQLAATEQWDQIGAEILAAIKNAPSIEEQKLLALSYGESMVRKGDFEGAYTQLYLLQQKYADELIGSYAQYMLLYLKAVHQDPYLAHAQAVELSPSIGTNLPLSPYLYLLRVDLALAAKDYKTMNTLLLQDNIGLPPDVQGIIQVREADYWHALGQTVKAYASYRLLADSKALPALPHSMSSYCETQYKQRKFREAAACYNSLAAKVTAKETLGLVTYRENMARLKIEPTEQLIGNFGQIETAFPQTEAGWRGALKRADLLLIKDETRTENLMTVYEDVAENSFLRVTREEAIFKVSLCHYLLGHNDIAIANTQKLLRNFRASNVKIPAQALLIELLPGEIKRLVDQKEYIKALVLAKQNRELFQNNWINSKFLIDIASAYQRIGIYDEAQRLYLYLIETMPVDQREQFFLPMIKATYDHGNYTLVEDYAVQYIYNYPKGQDTASILLLRIKALLAEQRLEEALNYLPDPLPQDIPFLGLAASLYFRSADYEKARTSLNQLRRIKPELNGEELFMLAESSYRTGQISDAKRIYNEISEQNPFFDQSLYRLAELARKDGDEKLALTIFEKMVEIGKSERWKSLAERELQAAKAQERTESLF